MQATPRTCSAAYSTYGEPFSSASEKIELIAIANIVITLILLLWKE